MFQIWMNRARRGKNAHMRPVFWLFLAFFALYVLTSGGHFYASDDVQKLAVLDAIFGRHSFAIPGGWVRAGDGLRYSWFTLGASAVMLPGWLGGQIAALCVPAVPLPYAQRFAVALENAGFSAALVAGLYACARSLGARAGAATYAALTLGLGTMIWPYAKTAWSEPVASLCLYAGLGAMYQASVTPAKRRQWLVGAGGTLALAASVRQELLLAVAGAVLFWIWQERKSPRLAIEVLLLAAPLVGVLALNVAYDSVRYGTPWGFPNYKLPQKNVIMQEGRFGWSLRNMYQYTLSPNQGLPWYSPGLLAAPFGLMAFWRARRSAALLLGAALVPLGAFYVIGWGLSSWAWGLRYSYVFLPALVLPTAWAWQQGRRGLLLGVLGLGLSVQLVALVPNPLELCERELAHTPGLTIQQLMEQPSHAPLWLALKDDPRLLANGLTALQTPVARTGSLRERRAGLPDVWWELILLEPVPRALVLLVVGLLGALGLFAGWRFTRTRHPTAGNGQSALPTSGEAE
jgi:hypothetical protein